jgi:hypothetical protein
MECDAPTDAGASAAPQAPAAIPFTTAAAPVSEADFEAIRGEMTREDEQRENLIKRSREVLKLAKNSIYALHRNDVGKATEMVTAAKEMAKRDLIPLAAGSPQLRHGALSGALEELAEACIFSTFLAEGRIPTAGELEWTTKEEYLGGIMECVGWAVAAGGGSSGGSHCSVGSSCEHDTRGWPSVAACSADPLDQTCAHHPILAVPFRPAVRPQLHGRAQPVRRAARDGARRRGRQALPRRGGRPVCAAHAV